MTEKEVIIVGAGISGLLAATVLKNRGVESVILEKARGIGGRMATRRTETGSFDHGAQFFTARTQRFQSIVDAWLGSGIAKEWSKGFNNAEGVLQESGHPRYCGTPTMTAPAKHLADLLDIRLSTQVEKIAQDLDSWHLSTTTGQLFSAPILILTAPVPQSLGLLSAGNVQIPEQVLGQLKQITYDPCFALLVELDKPSRIPPPGGMQINGEVISWIADNQQKGVSQSPTVTIHASAAFSRKHFDTPKEVVTDHILQAARRWLPGEPTGVQIHRWRYAQPTSTTSERTLWVVDPVPVWFAGDAFGEPRVEGAALSGLAAADHIIKTLRL